MSGLLIFFLLTFGLYGAGYLAAPLIIGLLYAIRFLGLAIWIALKALARGAALLVVLTGKLTGRGVMLAGRGVVLAFTFAVYLAQEALRGPRSDAEMDESLYEAARTLLGLSDDFTRASLDAAFKQAMKAAHPDAGGSTAKAQAVNAARDLLLRGRGWA